MPDPIGTWALAAESQLSDVEMAMIRPDAHLMRGYEAPDRSPILLYVGLYGGRAGYDAGAHDPEVCYPAKAGRSWGHAASRSRSRTARSSTRSSSTPRNGRDREAVLYWF